MLCLMNKDYRSSCAKQQLLKWIKSLTNSVWSIWIAKNNNDNEDIYMKHKLHIFPCNTCSYYLAINKSKLYPCPCIFIRHTFSRFNIKLQPFCLVIFCLYFALRCKREKLWAYTPNKICQSQPSGNFCAFQRRNCFSL